MPFLPKFRTQAEYYEREKPTFFSSAAEAAEEVRRGVSEKAVLGISFLGINFQVSEFFFNHFFVTLLQVEEGDISWSDTSERSPSLDSGLFERC